MSTRQPNCKIRMPRSHELDDRNEGSINRHLNNEKAQLVVKTNQNCGGKENNLSEEVQRNVFEYEINSKENRPANPEIPAVSNNCDNLICYEHFVTGDPYDPIDYTCTNGSIPADQIEDCSNNANMTKGSDHPHITGKVVEDQSEYVQINIDNHNEHIQKVVPVRSGVDLSQHYKKEKLLGSGKFGKVYKVTDRDTGRFAAAKEIQYNSAEVRKEIQSEIDILSQLSENEHVVKVFEVIECCAKKPETVVIITEFLEGGDLFTEISKDDILTETQVIDLIHQILEGVAYIHSKSILHRDLKPENIIYESKSNNKIKIIDFGLAVHFDNKQPPKSMVGTTLFVAPEVVKYENQSYQTDIWSVGVIAYDLLTGITPFEIPRSGDLERELSNDEILTNIQLCDFDFEDDGFIGVSEHAKSFISSILISDPKKRPSADLCLQHTWLQARDQVDFASPSRSVSVQRMRNYVALKKWEKISLAIQSVTCFKIHRRG